MLNFSKTKTAVIYLFLIFIGFCSFLNFFDNDHFFLNKKVNLGLDLQGGSYLLLEIDTDPLIQDRIQGKVLQIKKLLKVNKIEYDSFNILPKKITFKIDDVEIKKFEKFFFSRKRKFS